MTGPARITIELEPDARPGRWRTRTRVDGSRWSRAEEDRAPEGSAVATAMPIHVPEPREPAVVPAAYEPPTECTCVEGFCEADHENG